MLNDDDTVPSQFIAAAPGPDAWMTVIFPPTVVTRATVTAYGGAGCRGAGSLGSFAFPGYTGQTPG